MSVLFDPPVSFVDNGKVTFVLLLLLVIVELLRF